MTETKQPRYVVDEKGVHQTHVHNVPAADWYEMIKKVAVMLSRSDERAKLGLIRITYDVHGFRCDDPDCNRLHRKGKLEKPTPAIFRLARDIAPVTPSNPTNEKEAAICAGHPWKAGSFLCESCARVSMAKRLINEGWRAANP
jgi:hypothetical protein